MPRYRRHDSVYADILARRVYYAAAALLRVVAFVEYADAAITLRCLRHFSATRLLPLAASCCYATTYADAVDGACRHAPSLFSLKRY